MRKHKWNFKNDPYAKVSTPGWYLSHLCRWFFSLCIHAFLSLVLQSYLYSVISPPWLVQKKKERRNFKKWLSNFILSNVKMCQRKMGKWMPATTLAIRVVESEGYNYISTTYHLLVTSSNNSSWTTFDCEFLCVHFSCKQIGPRAFPSVWYYKISCHKGSRSVQDPLCYEES